jgi:hypothetical protein
MNKLYVLTLKERKKKMTHYLRRWGFLNNNDLASNNANHEQMTLNIPEIKIIDQGSFQEITRATSMIVDWEKVEDSKKTLIQIINEYNRTFDCNYTLVENHENSLALKSDDEKKLTTEFIVFFSMILFALCFKHKYISIN